MGAAQNPFAPPSEQAELGQTGNDDWDDRPLRIASRGARFVNSCVDAVCQQVLVAASAMVFQQLGASAAGGFLALIWAFGYYPIFEGAFAGKTPGKWLTHTRVVRAADGGRPRFMQILGRTLSRFVPFEPFSLLDAHPVGWHDRWSGTRVVRETR